MRRQLDILDDVYAECLERGLELFFSVPLLKFAVNDPAAVRAELDDLFDPECTFILDSGQYHATRGDRRRIHENLSRHPGHWVLEHLSWPEEHVALPYLGYLGDDWATRLAAANPLTVNFLLDTEYMGQGRLPAVLSGWWAGGLWQVRAYGARGANGRVMRWDQFGSLDSWNVVNIDLFCALPGIPMLTRCPSWKRAWSVGMVQLRVPARTVPGGALLRHTADHTGSRRPLRAARHAVLWPDHGRLDRRGRVAPAVARQCSPG